MASYVLDPDLLLKDLVSHHEVSIRIHFDMQKPIQDPLCIEHVLDYSSMKLFAKIISVVYPIRRNQDLRPQIRWLMDCPTSWLSYILETCSFGELGEQCQAHRNDREAQAQIRLSDVSMNTVISSVRVTIPLIRSHFSRPTVFCALIVAERSAFLLLF